MTDLATIDAEISRLSAEAAAVEQAGPTFAERWPAHEADLLACEETFRRIGPSISGFISMAPEHVAERHRAMVGLSLIANRKAVLDAERERITAQTRGGVSAGDKQRRGEQLAAALLKACARRELLVRDLEGDGFMARPVHAEMVVWKREALERLAA